MSAHYVLILVGVAYKLCLLTFLVPSNMLCVHVHDLILTKCDFDLKLDKSLSLAQPKPKKIAKNLVNIHVRAALYMYAVQFHNMTIFRHSCISLLLTYLLVLVSNE